MNELLDTEHQKLYTEALDALARHGVEFMLGGAFAVHHYSKWWRHTHDMDIYVAPESVDEAAEALRDAGFEDIGEQAEGDRHWIYHAGKEDLIVDVIWRFANLANYVSPGWFDRASEGRFLDRDARFLPLEELIWVKIFVINRHRCDWPDLMRVIRQQCHVIDWDRLLGLLSEHWLLLAGLVDVFDWQHPDNMGCIPDHVRTELARRRLDYGREPMHVEREHLLDPWLPQRADVHATWRNE